LAAIIIDVLSIDLKLQSFMLSGKNGKGIVLYSCRNNHLLVKSHVTKFSHRLVPWS